MFFPSFEDLIDKTIELMLKLEKYDSENSKQLIFSVKFFLIKKFLIIDRLSTLVCE